MTEIWEMLAYYDLKAQWEAQARAKAKVEAQLQKQNQGHHG